MAHRGQGQKLRGQRKRQGAVQVCHSAGGACCVPSPGHAFQGRGSQVVAGGPRPDLTPPPSPAVRPVPRGQTLCSSTQGPGSHGSVPMSSCPPRSRPHIPSPGHSTSGRRGESPARVTGKQKSLKARQEFSYITDMLRTISLWKAGYNASGLSQTP